MLITDLPWGVSPYGNKIEMLSLSNSLLATSEKHARTGDDMEKSNIEAFRIIGISIRTTNENGQSTKDIGGLWKKFMTEGILGKIPNKIDNTVYSIYTDYQSDHTEFYTTILGCKVQNIETFPDGMIARNFTGGSYARFVVNGDLTKGAVFVEWLKIWKMDLNRTYTADFEVYGKKAQNPADAEVEIFVAIQE